MGVYHPRPCQGKGPPHARGIAKSTFDLFQAKYLEVNAVRSDEDKVSVAHEPSGVAGLLSRDAFRGERPDTAAAYHARLLEILCQKSISLKAQGVDFCGTVYIDGTEIA
jgi:hypothetical protein